MQTGAPACKSGCHRLGVATLKIVSPKLGITSEWFGERTCARPPATSCLCSITPHPLGCGVLRMVVHPKPQLQRSKWGLLIRCDASSLSSKRLGFSCFLLYYKNPKKMYYIVEDAMKSRVCRKNIVLFATKKNQWNCCIFSTNPKYRTSGSQQNQATRITDTAFAWQIALQNGLAVLYLCARNPLFPTFSLYSTVIWESFNKTWNWIKNLFYYTI